MLIKELTREIYRKGKVLVRVSLGGVEMDVSVEKSGFARQLKELGEKINGADIPAARSTDDGNLYVGYTT